MKIKEVAVVTGLTLKAIRMYEEKGIVTIKRDDNSYRVFDEEAIERLKEIKLFRYLDISIQEIKKFYDGETVISELLENQLTDLETLEKQTVNQKRLCKALVEDYNTANKEKCVSEYLDIIGYMESDAYELEQKTFVGIIRGRWDIQILMTLVFLSPILSIALKVEAGNYEGLGSNLILGFVFTVLLTLSWTWFIAMRIKHKDREERENSSITLIIMVLCLILTFMMFAIVQVIQIKLFTSDNYTALGLNDLGGYCILFFEVELLILMFYLISCKIKISPVEALKSMLSGRISKKVFGPLLFLLNTILIVICLFSVTVIEDNSIHVRSIGNLAGATYELDSIEKIEVGYYTSGRDKGMFYYNIIMNDGQKVYVNSCVPNETYKGDNSYLWLKKLDEKIMMYSPKKLVDVNSEQGSYNYAEKYKKIFTDIMD